MTSFSAAQRSRVTMLDVAERAGVSKASVSRFIGDDRALLSDAIALRIEQAIEQLGHHAGSDRSLPAAEPSGG